MDQFLDFIANTEDRYTRVAFTAFLVFIYFLVGKMAARVIRAFGRRHGIGLSRVVYTTKYFRFITFTVCLVLLGLIWDISFKGLSTFFLAFFTVAGIGLFAAWSILSNITAAIIIFFYFPYRIGDKIRIMDGDNSVEGIIFDLNMFSIIIKNDKGQNVTYPNNMALQKGIILLKDG